MPEPMIRPTTKEMPLRYVIDLCFSNEGPSRGLYIGVPSAVYPAAVVERGKRLFAKSKAEDMEYVREWPLGRLPSFPDSSSSKDNFREDDIPAGEEVCEV